MSERFKELVLKTSDTATYREFESHTLRQKPLFMGGLNFFEKSVDKLSKAWYISEADSREQ